MGHRFLRVLAVASVLGLPATSLLGQSGAVTGRVTDVESGQPVRSAFVEALGASGRSVASTLANFEGAYALTGLAAGTFTLSVTAAGYGSQAVREVQVTAGGTANADLQVRQVAFELDAIVVSAGRQPEKASESVAHAEVVSEREISLRPAVTPVDHLRSIPGVDVITSGLQSTNVVVRGFNNIFSGSLHALTDNRIAAIPSLRVNLMHFVPQTNEDLERIEVVLGPGSALYGPNTANGVLHMITKSPLDTSSTTLTLSGGERDLAHVTGRTSHKLSDRFGFKVSGQYFRGREWRFIDSVEVAARTLAQTDFDAWEKTQPSNLTPQQKLANAARLAARDFDIERWSLDGRADWRVAPDATLMFTAGITNAASGIELTGIGAAQAIDWIYSYYQARFTSGRFFTQAYLNTSNAGDTYLLRTGAPIVDESKVLVGQLQHGTRLGNRQDFIYGADYIRTTPETGGTINGSREDDDQYDQYGVYLQSRTNLTPQLDLVLAGRGDWHTELDDPVFSPRAALLFQPTPAHSLRATYNRAFSTPTSLNLFLDIDGGPAGALGPFGFRVRAQGPGKDGIRLTEGGAPAGMRSPFNTAGASQLVAIDAVTLFDYQVTAIAAASAAAGTPLPPALVGFLRSLSADPTVAQMGIQAFDPLTENRVALANAGIQDIPGIKPSISSTFEVGYKGLIGERLLLAADVWRSKEKDFTSPLVLRTPLLLLTAEELVPYLVPRLTQAIQQGNPGIPANVAQEQAMQIAAGMAMIPGAVVSSEDVAAQGADLLATYVNFGELDLWGADLSAQLLFGAEREWSVAVTASIVSDHNFCLVDADECPDEQLVALNAPKQKGSASLSYRGVSNGLSGELRARHTGEFPVNSADFVGLQCIGAGGEECVESFTLLDLTLGMQLRNVPGASVQLAITNLFDSDYRSFVGVPRVGRLALLRLRYQF
jgi:iron complex outermembrane receptor protein